MIPEGGDGRTRPGPAKNRAVACHNGRGVGRYTTETVRWHLMAAEQGVTVSQIAIGVMCFTGEGIEGDDDEAEDWFRMVAEAGDPVALRIVEMLEDYDPGEGEGVRGSRSRTG